MTLLRSYIPDIRIRVVNVVGLMASQPQTEHPHGLEDRDFDAMFTRDKPVIFAFHGYPRMIHRLTYRRHNHDNFHVRGYKEEGTTTTPFDMVVLNISTATSSRSMPSAIARPSPNAGAARAMTNGGFDIEPLSLGLFAGPRKRTHRSPSILGNSRAVRTSRART